VSHVNYCVVPEKPTGKVSTLRELLRSCVDMMKDETMMNELYEIINHCMQGRETTIT
jgi:hypothetical protein